MMGSAEAICIAGIGYRSIFTAAIETGLSPNWILRRIRDSGGEPVIIRGHLVVLERWFASILAQAPWLVDILGGAP
jgi:hypothetical protein